MEEFIIFIVGALVSGFGTIIGFGGGVFMVPILIIFFGYNIEIAIGATMSALVPASIIASVFNLRDRSIDYLVGSLIQFPAVMGTVLGAFMVAFLPVSELQIIFALFVLVVGGFMVIPKKKKLARHSGMMYRIRRAPTSFIRKNRAKHLAYRLNGGVVSVFGFASGIIAGLFGIGGGFLQTPMMIKLFRMPSQIATSTSLFILVITSFTGFISHYLLGNVLWSRSLPLMAAFALGALAGNLMKKHRPPAQNLEKLIGLGLLLAGMGVVLNLLIKSNFGFSF
ncbi:sulfite exporter TauE/SafE family protein [Pontibacter sp. JH31]|uniref:Probable membrane transporter protein n=1 Tax=Pontibacter aquaedesilientis TaxID=2766980 RepID=A0ABR7XEH0_9BACT|nr:sulfite exporter TauE/SafE family protein [Pontibacter aquaedesilientis]MBD1396693.1 sulfite exporter TauE/SafE family protein [Pontibacter aquaedesilientis]